MIRLHSLFALSICCIASLAHSNGPKSPSASSPLVASVEVFPSKASFAFADDTQRFGVQVIFTDGSTKDVTGEVVWSDNSDIGLEADHLVVARASVGPAKGELHGEWQGTSVSIPYEILGLGPQRELSFRNDVLPLLTKTGCNSGKCHGSASGKDGFRLSLYGFDPVGDHYRITRELGGRRLNLSQPDNCLLVNKATGEVPHTGGGPMQIGDANYVKLVRWISKGAAPDPESMPLPVGIEVFPKKVVLLAGSETHDMIVTARYSDGSTRDVTDAAVFLSNNEAAAAVSEGGEIKPLGPGSAFVLARFDQFTSGTDIVVRSLKSYPGLDFRPNNYVDTLAEARWQDLHVLPSEVCSDEVFLRRIYLDTIGKLPTPKELKEFSADPSKDKRSAIIEELVGSDDFLDMWIMQLGELLQIRRANGLSEKGLSLYDGWLREQVHAGVSVDKLIRQLIPASGSTFENPATSYYQTETTPQLLAENIAQAFLGTRIQCAQCHNHPFDRWTMDDYYGFAAFVSQVGYKQAKDPREVTVYDLGEGSLEHPVAGRVVKPKFLGGKVASEDELGGDYRKALAEWLTENNGAFANNIANVMWAHFMGKGIVNPVDDVRVSNPPSNPELLNALGAKLMEYDFDVRKLAVDICSSKTYQLSTQKTDWNKWDDRNFSHASIRRLRAEVLLDCINQVTNSSDSLTGLPLGGRAIQIPDGRTNNYFLTTFGRSDRATPCSCEVSTAPTLSQALHLLNGENTTRKISGGKVIESLFEQGKDSLEVARSLYEMCYSRQPTAEEAAVIKKRLSENRDSKAALEDLFWALLNSNEFLFNH